MSTYKIGGVDVFFPHQAYGVQLSFMSKTIAALEAGQNALLEAPTGRWHTGRSPPPRRTLPRRAAAPPTPQTPAPAAPPS